MRVNHEFWTTPYIDKDMLAIFSFYWCHRFFPTFEFSFCESLLVCCVPWIQLITLPSYFMQSVSLCLFIGELKSSLLKVIVERSLLVYENLTVVRWLYCLFFPFLPIITVLFFKFWFTELNIMDYLLNPLLVHLLPEIHYFLCSHGWEFKIFICMHCFPS